MIQVLRHPDAELQIELLPDKRKLLTVKPLSPALYVARKSVTTSYPDELIELILTIKGPSHVCDEIARDADPAYVRLSLETDLLVYIPHADLSSRRILDFGCGSGASTMILHRLFPQATIISIELDPQLLSIAKARARHYAFPEEQLLQSPSGTEIPNGLGMVDCIVMSGVYEHLLPAEREAILPRLWALINDNGVLFLNQTPHRYTPVETHTTGLPLINYLPDFIAHKVACRFSKRIALDESWTTLLRRGIRGATEYEVLNILRRTSDGHPVLLSPSREGIRDRIDLWFRTSVQARWPLIKRALRTVFKTIKLCTGLTLVPSLSLAIQKQSLSQPAQ
jgi:2-polyprenyl-3-methyl-5-hydroxy-6-metoxy-1,4-benzoquinol methylase